MYTDYNDPDTRIAVSTRILSALIAGRHADYKVEQSDVEKAVEVADRLLAQVESTAPPEPSYSFGDTELVGGEEPAPIDQGDLGGGLAPEGQEPVPVSEAEAEPLDLTEAERADLPPLDGSGGEEPAPKTNETQPTQEPTGARPNGRRKPVDLGSGEGL